MTAKISSKIGVSCFIYIYFCQLIWMVFFSRKMLPETGQDISTAAKLFKLFIFCSFGPISGNLNLKIANKYKRKIKTFSQNAPNGYSQCWYIALDKPSTASLKLIFRIFFKRREAFPITKYFRKLNYYTHLKHFMLSLYVL